MLISTRKIFKDNKTAFVLQLCTRVTWKRDSFSTNQTRVIFSCILFHADIGWNFQSSYRRIHTDPASSNKKGEWEVCKHAKRQNGEENSRLRLLFPLNFFCAPAACCCFTKKQSFEASSFVNVNRLILKGGNSRLKLLSFEIFVFSAK